MAFHVVLSYCCSDQATDWKKSSFILPEESDLPVVDKQATSVNALPMLLLTLFLVDEILLPSCIDWSAFHLMMIWCHHNLNTRTLFT